MTNEEIVLSKLNGNRFLGKNPLHFDVQPENQIFYFSHQDYENYKKNFEGALDKLKSLTEPIDRVRQITLMKYNTYHFNNRFQCYGHARRSTCDIWRIYKYYFGDVDIFTIMRALYQLVVSEDLNTFRCPDIRKRVYWRESYGEKNIHVAAELGVPLSEWKNIGL